MTFDWKKSRGSEATQVARAILVHFLEDVGLTISDNVRMGNRDPDLLTRARAEAKILGWALPEAEEMQTTAAAIIRGEPARGLGPSIPPRYTPRPRPTNCAVVDNWDQARRMLLTSMGTGVATEWSAPEPWTDDTSTF